MDRIEAISKCRYYSGEEECPFVTDALRHYWEMERVYVAHRGELDKELMELYRSIGGKIYNGIPPALVVSMFGYWAKGAYDLKRELPQFQKLVEEYLQVASDHFPPDKIPHNIK